jgi:long-subunit acyl-CoA synthetase (AMP-forming)
MRELLTALCYRAESSGTALAFDDGLTRLDYAGLAGRVAGAAEDIRLLNSPSAIGILGGNRIEGVIGQLAGWHAGKITVPLPPFLPLAQLRSIAADAGISHILAAPDMVDAARQLGIPVTPISGRMAGWQAAEATGAGQIIYTSGTTDRPKGVLLGSGQLLWSGRALAGAMQASENDTYLSVLPLALLLETICAIVVPLLTGARVRLEPTLAAGFGAVDGGVLATAVALWRPSCMVLVPQLLADWVTRIGEGAAMAPDSLRFVAVGGASLAPALAEEAWALGIPVHEGYGLSECGSVVALNRPGERKAGTVGKPLPGLDVRIVDGEIVVGGPCVMDRYLHGQPSGGAWRTGDIGEIDADGYVTVRGRRDNILITSLGRNINPEWIEALLRADPRVAGAIVTHLAGPHLTALLVPSALGEDWFEHAGTERIAALISACCAEAPSYAIPRHFAVMSAGELKAQGLLTANGRIRRREALDHYYDLLARVSGTPVSANSQEFAR